MAGNQLGPDDVVVLLAGDDWIQVCLPCYGWTFAAIERTVNFKMLNEGYKTKGNLNNYVVAQRVGTAEVLTRVPCVCAYTRGLSLPTPTSFEHIFLVDPTWWDGRLFHENPWVDAIKAGTI